VKSYHSPEELSPNSFKVEKDPEFIKSENCCLSKLFFFLLKTYFVEVFETRRIFSSLIKKKTWTKFFFLNLNQRNTMSNISEKSTIQLHNKTSYLNKKAR